MKIMPVHKFKKQISYVENSPYWTIDEQIGWLDTGVTDCNGQHVFEGDIVNVNGTPAGAVYFRDGAFFAGGWLLKNYTDGEIEVIGHITEG